MRTIASCVEEVLKAQPFLEEALSREIINYSALAEELQEKIGVMLKKKVKTGAIMMALRRYNSPLDLKNSLKLRRVLNRLGDITVRSNLSDFTYKNSKTIITSHSKMVNEMPVSEHVFYAFTKGVYESNIIISSSEKNKLLKNFSSEILIGLKENLSAITIQLPKDNSKITGLYYQIFKRLAWEGITLYEVLSTTNEFTILVEDDLIGKAFFVIKNL